MPSCALLILAAFHSTILCHHLPWLQSAFARAFSNSISFSLHVPVLSSSNLFSISTWSLIKQQLTILFQFFPIHLFISNTKRTLKIRPFTTTKSQFLPQRLVFIINKTTTFAEQNQTKYISFQDSRCFSVVKVHLQNNFRVTSIFYYSNR